MRRWPSIAAGIALSALVSCGGGGGFRCNLDAATEPASSDWPMSRRDPANTGRIAATVARESPSVRCVYPEPADSGGTGGFADCAAGGPAIDTTAIVGSRRMILATRSGRVHVLDLTNENFPEISLTNAINLAVPANTPLLGADDSIFVTETSVSMRRFDGTTGLQMFAASLLSDTVVAPNIGPDGVLYAGSTGGFFAGVCTNGAFRFQRGFGGVSVPAAVTANPVDPERTLVLAAGDNGRLQGFDDERGDVLWSFFTANRLNRSAVVVDESREMFILPDTGGNIYAGSLRNGLPQRADGSELRSYRVASCLPSRNPCTRDEQCGEDGRCVGEVITASGALGLDYFYVATEGPRSETGDTLGPGSIRAYSLEFDGRDPEWVWTLPEGGQSQSSPVVAVDQDGEVLIAAADLECDDTGCEHGAVFAIADGDLLWQVDLPDTVGRAAASIRVDDAAAIFIGTAGGKLYEIR